MIANARMYSVAPAAAAAWRSLFLWVSEASGVAFEIVDHPYPASLEALWQRDDLAAVFMCGLPLAKDSRPLMPIASPLPAAPRYRGQAVYFTDFVVATESSFQTLDETFGQRIAYTSPSSHSGYNAARHHLLCYRRDDRPRLFASAIGPVVTPRRAVEAVAEGRAELAPVDSYALDLLRLHEPTLAGAVRIVESTAASPIPPLIASGATDEDETARLTQAFARIPPELLSPLAISGFARADRRRYAVLVEMEAEAVRAGYPDLA